MSQEIESKTGALTVHRGNDYAVIMRPDETTDTAFVTVRYPSDADMALLRKMAAAPEMFEALLLAREWLGSWESATWQISRIDAALAKARGQ